MLHTIGFGGHYFSGSLSHLSLLLGYLGCFLSLKTYDIWLLGTLNILNDRLPLLLNRLLRHIVTEANNLITKLLLKHLLVLVVERLLWHNLFSIYYMLIGCRNAILYLLWLLNGCLNNLLLDGLLILLLSYWLQATCLLLLLLLHLHLQLLDFLLLLLVLYNLFCSEVYQSFKSACGILK